MFFIVCIVFPLFCTLLSPRLSDFVRVFSTGRYRTVIVNTAVECICSTVFSVLLGYLYAYAVVRGEIPFVRFFSVVPVIHMVTPPFVGGLSFILLLGRQGFITKTLLGLDVSLYGLPGIVISQVLCFFPLAYLMCAQTLRGINPLYERAARGMGAGRLKVFISVTLPLSFPGILSSFLFVAVNVLSDFGNPLIVAGRFRVLAVEVYTQLTGWLNVGTSAVLGIVLIIPSVILFVIQNKMLKNFMPKISSIGGKNSFALGINFDSKKYFGRFSSIIMTLFVVFISLCVAAQFIAITVGSFQKLWGVNTSFTIEHFFAVRHYSKGLVNSVLFASIAAVLSTSFASVSSYIVHRTDSCLKNVIDVFSQIPSSIPGSLLGLAISIASNILNFHAAPVLIVIAMTVAFLPFSYRIISQSYAQISLSLDDSSRSLGANQMRTLFSVIAPIASNGIFSGLIYNFIRGVGTLSAVIFLVSFNTPLTSINIVNLAEQGDWGKSCALAFILTLITFLILGTGYGIIKIRERKIRL